MKVLLRGLALVVLLLAVAAGIFVVNPIWVADQQIRFRLWRDGVKSEYVEAGGYRLHYFEAPAAKGSGPPPLSPWAGPKAALPSLAPARVVATV